jgi:hypothetical protein
MHDTCLAGGVSIFSGGTRSEADYRANFFYNLLRISEMRFVLSYFAGFDFTCLA